MQPPPKRRQPPPATQPPPNRRPASPSIISIRPLGFPAASADPSDPHSPKKPKPTAARPMARVKQPRRTGALHRLHQGGSADARPNPVGKKPVPFARVFSPADDVRILEGLADYVAKHGKQPDPSKLHDACAVDKAEYTGTQIYEKVRRLKDWYFAKAKRADGRGVRDDARNDATVTTKYELSTKIWGKKRRAERRGFEEMRCLFPNLSATVDKIASESSCGALYKRAFELMDDEEAAGLEAKVKKQRIEATKMIMSRTTLTNQVLDVLIKSRD